MFAHGQAERIEPKTVLYAFWKLGPSAAIAVQPKGFSVDVNHLEHVPLFSSLPRPQLQRISQLADEVDVKPGKELVHEGAFAYEFFAIEDGTAEVTRAGEHIADLGPGDFFGEIGSIKRDARNATVTATSPLTAIVMSAGDFRRMSAELPEVAAAIEEAVRERTERQM